MNQDNSWGEGRIESEDIVLQIQRLSDALTSNTRRIYSPTEDIHLLDRGRRVLPYFNGEVENLPVKNAAGEIVGVAKISSDAFGYHAQMHIDQDALDEIERDRTPVSLGYAVTVSPSERHFHKPSRPKPPINVTGKGFGRSIQ